MPGLETLLSEVRRCRLCAAELPFAPKPVLQCAASARILIAGQAPGRRAHASGIPFDDASGERLRDWMGIGRETFYDAGRIAILPLGFCYPGSARSGDLPPRPLCAERWRRALLEQLPRIELTLALGSHAQAWHFDSGTATLTARVRAWRQSPPGMLPLPHPSPRNNGWLGKNPWFAAELLPALRARIARILEDNDS